MTNSGEVSPPAIDPGPGPLTAAEIIRANGVSATMISPIAGISPWGDRWTAYAHAKGLIAPEEQTEEMFWGTRLQRVIAQVFCERMELPIEWSDQRVYSKTRPWQCASPDAFILTQPKRQVLECKTAGLHQSHEWDREATNEDGVPDYYVAQVEWQLSTCELEVAYVAVLIAGNDFRIYRIEHDPVLEEILLEEGERFWREHLMSNVPPPIGGSQRARQYLGQRYPRHREKLRPATLDEIAWLDEYAVLRAQSDVIESRRDELENQLKQAIGEAEGLSWSRGKLTWKKSKDHAAVNWEELAENQLVGYSKEEKAALVAQYTETVHGSRRLYFRPEEAR